MAKPRIKYLGQFGYDYNYSFQNTVVGGLSGIDYDSVTGLFYLICDDRSDKDPARFYTAIIHFDSRSLGGISLTRVTTLLDKDGKAYPNSRQDPQRTPDPEALRVNPRTGDVIWTSEGERNFKNGNSWLADPSITIMGRDGKYRDTFVLPSNMHMQKAERGPRQNGVFEGATFINGYKNLLVSVEEPVYEDGPRAGGGDSAAWIRIINFDVATKKPVAQYGYRIDPVAHPANPPGDFKINGVPDILALDDKNLLVMERSFSSGRLPCTIKIYLTHPDEAEDIQSRPSLLGTSFRSLKKTLILNMDALGIYIDNVEGMTLGPRLSNGHRSLVCVSDNNFAEKQQTQILLFEIEE